MKKIVVIVLMLMLTSIGFAQIPSMIEVSEDNWESWYGGDFKNGFCSTGCRHHNANDRWI